MLDDQQGRDVESQFWSYFYSKELTYSPIFHPFSLHLVHFDVYLISNQVFNFNLSISKVFIKIWFLCKIGRLRNSRNSSMVDVVAGYLGTN